MAKRKEGLYYMLKKEIVNNKAEEIQKDLVKWRRRIHQNPETGFNEIETSNFIAEKLEDFNIPYQRVCKTGITGLIKGSKPGETLAIRADIDALAMEEKNNVIYKSKNKQVMHACGHDGHTTILLGAAKLLSEMKEKIRGNVKLLFQPAEEGPGGAKPMIEAGVLNNPDVDYMLALHINPDIEKNMVGIKQNVMMAAPDIFEITIKGKGAHGAHPEKGVDPISIGAQIVLGLQHIKSRELNTHQPVVISCGSFQAGNVFNVIPEVAKLKGTVRTFDHELRQKIKTRIIEMVKNITKAYRAECSCDYDFRYPPLINDEELTRLMKQVIKKDLGEEYLYEIAQPSMGGEDFAYFAKKAQSTYMLLGTRNEEMGITHALHSPYFDFDEDILKQGVKLFVHGVNRILNC